MAETIVPPESELIILLDTTSAQKLANSPEDVLRSVASSTKSAAERALFVALGSPTKARYVISERLSAEQVQRFGADSPRVLLDQFVVLSYPDTASADISRTTLASNKGIASVVKNARYHFSTTPSDPGFQSGPFGPGFMNYQWGLQQMNFPAAWDTVKGNAYVAVLDTGIMLGHPDLTANFKPHLSTILSGSGTLDDELGGPGIQGIVKGHGTHVAGIIGANTNNGVGVAGGCWNCALLIGKISSSYDLLGPPDLSRVAAGITYAVDAGAQVVNMSFGSYASRTCVAGSTDLLCAAIAHATRRSAVLIAAAGNNIFRRNSQFALDIGDVQEPANQFAVIPVGAMQPTLGSRGRLWTETRLPAPPLPPNDESFSGSSAGPSMESRGVVAPGMDVFSSVYTNNNYSAGGFCGDSVTGSGTTDGYGPCTGTSMAAPHISALVGLMRSVNPWVPADAVRTTLHAAADMHNSPNTFEGHGQPNAATAVQFMVATNPGRLIPLLSMYSSLAQNYFYTTVPQMASAAYFGTMKPAVPQVATSYSFVGPSPTGFTSVPDGSIAGITTGAQAWVLGTYQNPNPAGAALRPLIRMSYICYQNPNPDPACATNPYHVDHLLSTDMNNEVAGYLSVGYKIDGVEGYVYDAAYPQPVGTESLVRAYNLARDDHAVFPLREQCSMAAQGYTLDVTTLGYAYPVTTYPAPPPLVASLLAVKSRKTHGAAGTYDLALNASVPVCGAISIEPRSHWSGHQIVFQFSAPIAGPFTATVVNSSGASIGTATASATGNEVVVAISGVPENHRAKVTVTASNGMVVGTVSMGFLIGDSNDSGSVDSSDISAVKFRSGQTVNGSNFKYDPNLDGAINANDVSWVKARSGWVLPN